MSMPEIPPQQHRPDLYHTIIDLLESIALEEMALSHLLKAEAEKIQHFINHASSCTPPDVLIDFNVLVNETLETVVMKEWLLLRKLEKVTRIFYRQFPPPVPPPIPPAPPAPPRPPAPPSPPQPFPPIYTCRAHSTCRVSYKPRRPARKPRLYYEE